MPGATADDRVVVELDGVNAVASLRSGKLGVADPCAADDAGRFVRAMRTPDGPVTLSVRRAPAGALVEAWGAGAAWALGHAREIAGAEDGASTFAPAHPLVAKLWKRHGALRIPRLPWTFDALAQIVLLQRVSSRDASLQRRTLTKRVGEAAPGPFQLLLPLSGEQILETPRWLFTKLAVDVKRASTLLAIARHESRIAALASATHADARALLAKLDGIGPWTTESLLAHVLGDADAVPTGDYWLPHGVTYAFTGDARGDDARMLALLEPFRPHRGRVVQLLGAAGIGPPRFAPRRASPLFRRRG
jgi:3-methyladenine DNA glycosylase/8-oxoguanine DNA glycosylase